MHSVKIYNSKILAQEHKLKCRLNDKCIHWNNLIKQCLKSVIVNCIFVQGEHISTVRRSDYLIIYMCSYAQLIASVFYLRGLHSNTKEYKEEIKRTDLHSPVKFVSYCVLGLLEFCIVILLVLFTSLYSPKYSLLLPFITIHQNTIN